METEHVAEYIGADKNWKWHIVDRNGKPLSVLCGHEAPGPYVTRQIGIGTICYECSAIAKHQTQRSPAPPSQEAE